jgi:transcriptional regulator with XRE-family HTH domain
VDKRRKALTPHEQLLLRQQMMQKITAHPEWDVPRLIKEARKSLHLTLEDMARIGRISVPTLKNIESRRSSPTLATIEALLHPLGLRVGVIQAHAPASNPEWVRE